MAGNDPTARLYCLNLDGSDRKVVEYGANMVFPWNGCVAGDKEGNLYTVLLIVDPDRAAAASVLAKLGRSLPTYETLHSWDEPLSAKLVGVCDAGFIIQVQDTSASSSHTELVLVRDGGKEQLLLGWSGLDITSYTIHKNVLYYTKNGDPFLYAQNVLDDSAPVRYDPYDAQGFTPNLVLIRCEARDDHLIVQYGGSEEPYSLYAALDLSTEEFTPLNLYHGEGEDKTLVGIYAEGKNDFLVCVGEFTRSRMDYGADGTPYTFEQGVEDYVLISKSDYWNNIPNYRRFQYYE